MPSSSISKSSSLFIQTNLAHQGGQRLGSLLWWALNGNRIGHDALEALAQRHNLPDKYLPRPVKPPSAFRRAWRHASTNLDGGLMLRQIADTADSIVIGIVKESPDQQALDLDYNVQAHTTADIHTMITNFIHEAGVSKASRPTP